jgi:hypothetical protein
MRPDPFGPAVPTRSPSEGVLAGPGVRHRPPQGLSQAGQSRVRGPAPGWGQWRLRATIMATTKARARLFCAAMRDSQPGRRRVPRTAAPWP